RPPVLHTRQQRDHAGKRKIDVLDLLSHVVQHDAALERDRPQMRRQQRKVLWRQRRQESVEFSVLQLPGNGGRAIGHQEWLQPYVGDAFVKRACKIVWAETARVQPREFRDQSVDVQKSSIPGGYPAGTTLFPARQTDQLLARAECPVAGDEGAAAGLPPGSLRPLAKRPAGRAKPRGWRETVCLRWRDIRKKARPAAVDCVGVIVRSVSSPLTSAEQALPIGGL